MSDHPPVTIGEKIFAAVVLVSGLVAAGVALYRFWPGGD